MAREPLTITLEPDSDLARALADADVAVILESDGVRYTVSREHVFARYDAQAALRGRHREIWEGVEPQEYVRQERDAWQT